MALEEVKKDQISDVILKVELMSCLGTEFEMWDKKRNERHL